MAREPRRICKGQVAIVAGLMLAFQPYTEACKVVGISSNRMRPYLPADWTHRRNPRTKWFGETLANLEKAWRDFEIPVRKIMADFNIDQSVLYKLAAKHRWPYRPKGRKPKAGYGRSGGQPPRHTPPGRLGAQSVPAPPLSSPAAGRDLERP